MTVAAFEALLDRRQEQTKREFLLAGTVAAAVYNANPFRGKDSKPVKASDFVPNFNPQISQIEQKKQTPEEQLAILKQVVEALKQKKKRKIKRDVRR